MTFDDFVREATPVAYEIICECLKMNAEKYQEYKTKTVAKFSQLEEPWIMDFWGDVFALIESYRDVRKEAATCKE